MTAKQWWLAVLPLVGWAVGLALSLAIVVWAGMPWAEVLRAWPIWGLVGAAYLPIVLRATWREVAAYRRAGVRDDGP